MQKKGIFLIDFKTRKDHRLSPTPSKAQVNDFTSEASILPMHANWASQLVLVRTLQYTIRKRYFIGSEMCQFQLPFHLEKKNQTTEFQDRPNITFYFSLL